MRYDELINAVFVLALLILVALCGCAASGITSMDAAIIQHGCRDTIEKALVVIGDLDNPAYARQDAEQRIIKAKALDEWTRTGRFPTGAPTGDER